MKGTITVEATGAVDAVAEAVRRLLARGLAARLLPRVAYPDAPKEHVTLLVEAHAGVENPSAEDQREVIDVVQEVIADFGQGIRYRGNGVVLTSSLDLRVVVDPDGRDLGLKLWARDAAEAELQLDEIARFTGCPREWLFTALLPSIPRDAQGVLPAKGTATSGWE